MIGSCYFSPKLTQSLLDSKLTEEKEQFFKYLQTLPPLYNFLTFTKL